MKNNLLGVIIFLVSVCAAIMPVHAETVTQSQARSLAAKFFNTAYGEVVPEPKLIWNGRQFTTDRLFSPFYIFNSDRNGYVIISGDNKAYPVLGYSLKRKFDRAAMTEEEKEFLQNYAREIEIIRYDSRMPVNAMTAWQNIPEYITKMINSPYLDNETYGDMSEYDRDKLERVDRLGSQILMPSAVEFKVYDPRKYRDIELDDVTEEKENEYVPFSFYDEFIKELKREENERARNYELVIAPDKPIVKGFGSGSYQIDFPEKMSLVRLYSLDGLQVNERYFKDTQTVFLNFEGEASGYYVAMALSETGKVYGLKLVR